MSFVFDQFFVLDLANNHQGDLAHASVIIKQCGQMVARHNIRAGLKFQFRELETFVHPDFKDRDDIEHIPRLLGTRLSDEDFQVLTQCVRDAGLTTIATPFDEPSVDLLESLNIQVIKVASCSAIDWPLLDRIARAKRPTIISTGGLSMSQIDRLVSFFEFKDVRFGLMHCVSIYPTPNHQLRLNQIALLRQRFPHLPVGWSTHEDQDDPTPVQIAVAKGAVMFERHVGLATDQYQLNNYSSIPQQLGPWFAAYHKATEACGGTHRAPSPPEESAALASLMRGVWTKSPITTGQLLDRSNVFFAMPIQDGQLASGQWTPTQVANRDYAANEPIDKVAADHSATDDEVIYGILLQISGMLNLARVFVAEESSVELSHHYGLQRFREFGCVLINCINRDYCKKLVVMLPRQKHPYHYHRKKEETFQLLHGDLNVEIEGTSHTLKPGDTLLVSREQWHKFDTLDGAIFEEVSTTAFEDDSFYEDKAIANQERDERKTHTRLLSFQSGVRHYFNEHE